MFAKKITATMCLHKESGEIQTQGMVRDMTSMATLKSDMANTGIIFKKQFNGYDRAQVDAYVDSIAGAYQTAYCEYNAKCEAYDRLMANFQELEAREAERPSAEAVSNTLFKAEEFSEKIMADARAEAERIKESAYIKKAAAKIQAQRLLDDAAVESAKTLAEAQAVLNNANAETGIAREKAQKMLDDVSAEVARIEVRANSNLEQANAKLAQTIGEIQKLLAPRASNAQA